MDNNMPKIKFSDFLGAQLKEFRMQYKKKAVDVAKYMDDETERNAKAQGDSNW